MARRGKLVLARINDQNRRKAALRKRTAGLLNKVREITTVCGAKATVVIYKPDDNQPTVWPSISAARETISEFLRKPEVERMANSHTAKSFTEEQCRKKKEKSQRLVKNNEERNVQALITSIYEEETRIQDLDTETKKRLNDFTDQKIKEIRKHIQRLKKELAPNSAQVLPLAVQMPPVSQATGGLNMNGLGAGINCESPAKANGQLMDVGGMTPFAPALTLPLPTSNLFVMLPNNTTVQRLDKIERLHGPSNFVSIMQQEPLSLAQQTPSVSQVADGLEALNINGLSAGGNFQFPAAEAHGQDINLRGTDRLEMTGRLYGQTTPGGTTQLPLPSPSLTAYSEESVPDMTGYSLINGSTRENNREIEQHTPSPSLLLDFSHIHSSSNTFDMTGLNEQTKIGGIMQYFPPSPLQSMTSSLYMNDNGLNNACTRTFTEDGNFGEKMQDALSSYMLPELPCHQQQMPSIQYDVSGSNLSGAEYSRSRIGFPTPGTTALDQSNFGDDYRLYTDGFLGTPTNPLDQRNFRDGE